MRRQDSKDYLFELPTCPICLLQLSSNINALPCGHCFHQDCINRHLEKRNACPNCRKYTDIKDIRPIFYEVVRNCKMRESINTLELREEVIRMRTLIESYEEGTQYCYQQINFQQNQNMNLKKRIKAIEMDMKGIEECGKSKLQSIRQMLRNSRNKESILLREIKMLKLLLKFKFDKEKDRNHKIPLQEVTNMGSFNEDAYEESLVSTQKGIRVMRRSSSVH